MMTYRKAAASACTGRCAGSATGPIDVQTGRRRRTAVLAPVIAMALLATGCTGGPGNQDDFVDVLTLNDNFTEAQAICIAEAVFDEYGEDDDNLQKISGAESYEYLLGEDGVEGFDSFFNDTVAACTTVGPSPDS